MAPLGAFRVSFSETQANNSSEFFDKEVFSPWHSKQASSAHDLARNFFCFCILFPRETRERPLLLLVSFPQPVFCLRESALSARE